MIRELIEQGMLHHRSGRLEQAKLFYEQVLTLQARHPDALHLLGVIALETGDPLRAIGLIEEALRGGRKNPGFHANLANAYLAVNRPAEARAAFRRAAGLDARQPQFALGAAICLAMAGRTAEAERELRTLLRRHPDYALAWLNMGHAVRDQGRLEDAAAHYRRALELDAALAEAHKSLGSVLHRLERFDEAELPYRQCLSLQPDSAEAHCNLASLLVDRGRFAASAELCRQALARHIVSADLYQMLGAALVHQGRFAEAREALYHAVRLNPQDTRALWGYGLALHESGASDAGLKWLNRAQREAPDDPDYRDGLAGVHLSRGELPEGWNQYAWRPARQRCAAGAPAPLPESLPRDLAGRRVCLLPEQGLGDQLFFLRYSPALKARGAHVLCHAHPKLASLMARVAALDEVIPASEPMPAADFFVPLGDLPRLLCALESSPVAPLPAADGADGRPMEYTEHTEHTQYARSPRIFFPPLPPPLPLIPESAELERVRARLAALGPAPYLALTWRAGTLPEHARGAHWSLHKVVPLEALGSALRGSRATLLSVQRHPGADETDRLAAHIGRTVHDLSPLNEALESMLALLCLVDEYAGVSNTNTHLRAGVQRSARVLVPRPAEWRWMKAGDASPWFPGFSVYRQASDGDWSAGLARLRADIVKC